MAESNSTALKGPDGCPDFLTELLRTGACQLIAQAVEAELQVLLATHKDSRLADGRAAVVRNGFHPEREIQTGIGPVKVRVPKVRSKTGEPVTFRSALVPPYVRKTKSLEAAPLAVFARHFHRRNVRGAKGIGRPDGEGLIGQHRCSL